MHKRRRQEGWFRAGPPTILLQGQKHFKHEKDIVSKHRILNIFKIKSMQKCTILKVIPLRKI